MPYDFLTADERRFFQEQGIAERGQLRRLRIFISHRWNQHAKVYKEIERELVEVFGEIQNLSIPEDKRLEGPNGKYLADYKLKSEMAARIYTSDIILSPSNVGMGTNVNTRYEVEMAAVAYSVPIIFIKLPNQIRSASFVRRAKEIGIEHQIAHLGTGEIAAEVRRYVDHKVLTTQFPIEKAIDGFSQRGPKHEVLDGVLRQEPYLNFVGKLSVFDSEEEISARVQRRRNRWSLRRRR